MSTDFGSGYGWGGSSAYPTLTVTQPTSSPTTSYPTSSNLSTILQAANSINNGYGGIGSTGPSIWMPGVEADILSAYASAPQLYTNNYYSAPSTDYSALLGLLSGGVEQSAPAGTAEVPTGAPLTPSINNTINNLAMTPLGFTPGNMPDAVPITPPTSNVAGPVPTSPVGYAGGNPYPMGGGAVPISPSQPGDAAAPAAPGGGLGQGMTDPTAPGGGGDIPPALAQMLQAAIEAKANAGMPNILPPANQMLAQAPGMPGAPVSDAMPGGPPMQQPGFPTSMPRGQEIVPPPAAGPVSPEQMQQGGVPGGQPPQQAQPLGIPQIDRHPELMGKVQAYKEKLDQIDASRFEFTGLGRQLKQQLKADDKAARNLNTVRHMPLPTETFLHQAAVSAYRNGPWITPAGKQAMNETIAKEMANGKSLDEAYDSGVEAAAATSQRMKDLIFGVRLPAGVTRQQLAQASKGATLGGIPSPLFGGLIRRLPGARDLSGLQQRAAQREVDVKHWQELEKHFREEETKQRDRGMTAENETLNAAYKQARDNVIRTGLQYKQQQAVFEQQKVKEARNVTNQVTWDLNQVKIQDREAIAMAHDLIAMRGQDFMRDYHDKMVSINQERNEYLGWARQLAEASGARADDLLDWRTGLGGQLARESAIARDLAIAGQAARQGIPFNAPATPIQKRIQDLSGQLEELRKQQAAGNAAQAPAQGNVTSFDQIPEAQKGIIKSMGLSPEAAVRFYNNASKLFPGQQQPGMGGGEPARGWDQGYPPGMDNEGEASRQEPPVFMPPPLNKGRGNVPPAPVIPGVTAQPGRAGAGTMKGFGQQGQGASFVPPPPPTTPGLAPGQAPPSFMPPTWREAERLQGKSLFDIPAEAAGIPSVDSMQADLALGLNDAETFYGKTGGALEPHLAPVSPFYPGAMVGRAGGIDGVLKEEPTVNEDMQAYTEYLLNTPYSQLKRKKRKK